MYPSVSYFALVANILYSFNLVNYSEPDDSIQQLGAMHNWSTIKSSNSNRNPVHLAFLEDHDPKTENIPEQAKNTPTMIILPASVVKRMEKANQHNNPLPPRRGGNFTSILLWAIAIYFASQQVYNLWQQHLVIWKRCLVTFGVALALYMEYAQYTAPFMLSQEWLHMPPDGIPDNVCKFILIGSVLLNIILLTVMHFRTNAHRRRRGRSAQNGGFTHLRRPATPQQPEKQLYNPHLASPQQQQEQVVKQPKRFNAQYASSTLMRRFIGDIKAAGDQLDGDMSQEAVRSSSPAFGDSLEVASVASTTRSELSSIYCCSSVGHGLSAVSPQDAKLQAFQQRLRASTAWSSSPANLSSITLDAIPDSISEMNDEHDGQAFEEQPSQETIGAADEVD